MKGRNNLAIAAILVALLVLAAVFVFLWPRPGTEPTVGQAPSEAPAKPPAAGEKPAEPPTPVDDKATDESPAAADRAEDTPAPAEEKATGESPTAAGTPTPAEDKTADTSVPSEEKEADESPSASDKAEDAFGPAQKKTAEAPAQTPAVPSFDVVRIEPTGDGVIAGRAEPGWRISVESSGMQVAMAEADDQGEWTVILDRPLAPGPHTLSLRATSPDGKERSSSKQTVSAEVATPPTKTAVAGAPEKTPAQVPIPGTAAPKPSPPEAVPEERDVPPPGRVAPGEAPPLPQTAAIQEGKATPPSSLPPQDRPGTYTILPGDTLWDIAQRYLGAGWRYKSIYRDNRKIIRNPNLIYPEQRMDIPEPPGEPN